MRSLVENQANKQNKIMQTTKDAKKLKKMMAMFASTNSLGSFDKLLLSNYFIFKSSLQQFKYNFQYI